MIVLFDIWYSKQTPNNIYMGTSGNNKMLNVLSFDGGGSRGIMEAMLLDDFTRLVTLMKFKPDAYLVYKLINNKRDFVKLLHPLDENDEDPIEKTLMVHPTEIFNMIAGKNTLFFDMFTSCSRSKINTTYDKWENIKHVNIRLLIIGTSTGSLIAFGLVAGNKKSDGSREPMTVNEIIELYRNGTKNIFVKNKIGIILGFKCFQGL